MLELIELKDIQGLIFYVIVRISITLLCWLFVIFANLVDFWSGISTAKSIGEPLESHGFRRTITKISDYWRVLLFALMFDVLGAFLSFYVLPFLTILSTAAIICIEARSVIENSNRKKAHAAEIPDMVKQIVEAVNSEQGIEVLNKIIKQRPQKHKHDGKF